MTSLPRLTLSISPWAICMSFKRVSFQVYIINASVRLLIYKLYSYLSLYAGILRTSISMGLRMSSYASIVAHMLHSKDNCMQIIVPLGSCIYNRAEELRSRRPHLESCEYPQTMRRYKLYGLQIWDDSIVLSTIIIIIRTINNKEIDPVGNIAWYNN